jgi:2-C-methyl-D-erythritol 4-phosphate cytidylyltransferase
VTVAVIIVAAGRGTRMGSDVPKQYLSLGTSTPIRLSIDAFMRVPAVRWIVPVIHPGDVALYHEALGGLSDDRLCPPVDGGATRALSVRKGLESLQDAQPDNVLIHDSARPFVSERIISDVISALQTHEGACAALPVVDALWSSDGNSAMEPIPRDGLWRAQTPQGFRYHSILKAHRTHDGTGTDDVAVARQAGMQVTLVLGSEQNYKITTQSDYERAQRDVQALSER